MRRALAIFFMLAASAAYAQEEKTESVPPDPGSTEPNPADPGHLLSLVEKECVSVTREGATDFAPSNYEADGVAARFSPGESHHTGQRYFVNHELYAGPDFVAVYIDAKTVRFFDVKDIRRRVPCPH